ncbi:MAG: hypothetical protein METHAR1v1_160020 [Methanothrix sp.]|jgi:hypothetical protein|nr:MAG: hypothetical protein METHAR1v1_160020 [Methanothrix sp.]
MVGTYGGDVWSGRTGGGAVSPFQEMGGLVEERRCAGLHLEVLDIRIEFLMVWSDAAYR